MDLKFESIDQTGFVQMEPVNLKNVFYGKFY